MGVRRSITRLAIGIAAALAWSAAPAAAAVNIDGWSVTPESLQAGGSTNVNLTSSFSTADNDDIRDITVSMAPGLFANPTVVLTPCSEASFNANTCASNTQVGSGSVTVAAGGSDFPAAARLFMLAPATAGGLRRLGLDATAAGARVTTILTVTARPADGGFDLAATGLPRQVMFGSSTIDIFIKKVDLTLPVTVNGKPFIRMPSYCANPASSRLSIVSYNVATPVTADNAFTATGCDSLAFAPTLTATAVTTDGNDGVELTSTLGQAAGEAAIRKAVLTLPEELSPRASTLDKACTTPDVAACPESATVGSASVTTPLLQDALPGKLVLKAVPGGLPQLVIVLSSPVPLQIAGSSSVTSTGRLETTFDNLPDVPLTSLAVKLTGGAGSLLQAKPALCSDATTVAGEFTGQNAKTQSRTPALIVTGCPAISGRIKLSGLTKVGKMVAKISVPATLPALTKVKLKLPKGLSFDRDQVKRGLKIRAGSRTITKATLTGRSISFSTGRSGARSISVTARRGLLVASDSLKRKIRAGTAGELKFSQTLTDTGGKSTPLRLSATPR